MLMSPTWRTIRLVHPFPSLINAAIVLGLALIADGSADRAAVLALGMLGLQFCIGATNDLVDATLDARSKPWKPIPSALVSRRSAAGVALLSGGSGLLLATSAGPITAALALAMLGCGLVYDLYLKPTAWAWACFSVAFALLPLYAWYGASGELPPRIELLLPLAALAGPLIQLSNGLSDLESDRAAGLSTLASRMGRRLTLQVIVLMLVVIHGIAWLTLTPTGSIAVVAACAAATTLAGDWPGALSAAGQGSARDGLDGPGRFARPAGYRLAGSRRQSVIELTTGADHRDRVLQAQLGDGQVFGQVGAVGFADVFHHFGRGEHIAESLERL